MQQLGWAGAELQEQMRDATLALACDVLEALQQEQQQLLQAILQQIEAYVCSLHVGVMEFVLRCGCRHSGCLLQLLGGRCQHHHHKCRVWCCGCRSMMQQCGVLLRTACFQPYAFRHPGHPQRAAGISCHVI